MSRDGFETGDNRAASITCPIKELIEQPQALQKTAPAALALAPAVRRRPSARSSRARRQRIGKGIGQRKLGVRAPHFLRDRHFVASKSFNAQAARNQRRTLQRPPARGHTTGQAQQTQTAG